MKPVIRYRSQLLFRKSYKPNRILRIKPAVKMNFIFRPVRFGMKPKIVTGTETPDDTTSKAAFPD